jgi:hypothetical protein
MSTTHNKHEQYAQWQAEEYKLINDRVVSFRDVCVHEFTMGDVEDPDLYAAQPIWEWQESEAGQFVMEHAVEKPYWIRQMDYSSYGIQYKIIARLSGQNELFWKLKYVGTKEWDNK